MLCGEIMVSIDEKLKKLKEENEDVSLILDTFKEINRVYEESVEATVYTKEIPPVMNSNITLSHQNQSLKIDSLLPIKTDRDKGKW